MNVNRLWVEAQRLHNRATTSAQMQWSQIGCWVDCQGLFLRDAPSHFTSTAVSRWIIPGELRNKQTKKSPTHPVFMQAIRREYFVTSLGKLDGELLWNGSFSLQEQSLEISYKILPMSVSNSIILSKKTITSCTSGINVTLRAWLHGWRLTDLCSVPLLWAGQMRTNSVPEADSHVSRKTAYSRSKAKSLATIQFSECHCSHLSVSLSGAFPAYESFNLNWNCFLFILLSYSRSRDLYKPMLLQQTWQQLLK